MNQKIWHKPSDKLPEQGKKVLCEDDGDFYILHRFKNYWFSIPFNDSKWSRHHPPKLWQEIDFPNGLTGKVRMMIDGSLYDMDELEKKYPKIFEEFVDDMVEYFKNNKKATIDEVNRR